MEKIYQCISNERHVFVEHPSMGLCPRCPSGSFRSVLARQKGEKGFDEAVEFITDSLNPIIKKSEFEKLLKNAQLYLNRNNFDDALREYRNALLMNIDNDTIQELMEEAEKLKEEYLKAKEMESKEMGPVPEMEGQEAGLSILLMDVSDSMNQPAFKGAQITRLQMVAKSAAYGIFSLGDMSNNEYAFLHIYKFDHEVTPVIFSSIGYLCNKYGSAERLEQFLYEELSKRNGQTDINTALSIAYEEAKQFASGSFKILGNYVVKESSAPMEDGSVGYIKNIGVLLYTDGMHYVSGRENEKIKNPFLDSGELGHDVLIGAFIGNPDTQDCKDLVNVLSTCVKKGHDEKQFFLIDGIDKMSSFKRLFRMASGASGYCPKCMVDVHRGDKMD